MGTTSSQKKLFFNLKKLKNKIGAFEDGDLLPENVEEIARQLNVPGDDVVAMTPLSVALASASTPTVATLVCGELLAGPCSAGEALRTKATRSAV